VKSPRLASMSLDALLAMRIKIEKFIEKHVARESDVLRRKLNELEQYGSGGPVARAAPAEKRAYKKRKAKRGKAPIKYRGPGGETWSGRGMTPLWLRPLLKKGKKLGDFSVDKATKRKSRKAKSTKKVTKAAKKKAVRGRPRKSKAVARVTSPPTAPTPPAA
jgi:DNA-binding protein H-NS